MGEDGERRIAREINYHFYWSAIRYDTRSRVSVIMGEEQQSEEEEEPIRHLLHCQRVSVFLSLTYCCCSSFVFAFKLDSHSQLMSMNMQM